ncbi:MAG: VOC family protein [Pseudomonadota bacterium]
MANQVTGGGFIWYELMTSDAAGAAAFYNAVVGWNIPAEGHALPNGVTYRMIGRPDGGNAGGLLELTPVMLAAGAAPLWLAYVHTPDLSGTVAQAVALGASVQMPEVAMDAGRMAMLADPWGAPLYFMDPTPPPGQPDAVSDVFSVDQPCRMAWNELAVPDPKAALAYYHALFGWEQTGEMDMGQFGTYHFIAANGVQIGAIYGAERTAPGWTYYIRVADVRASAASIRAHGGTITNDLHEVPGGDLIVTATDPQGARFALVGRKD